MNIDFRVIYQSYDCSVPLSEEIKSYYIRNLTDVVKQLSADLDIPPTCKIVVPDNFEKELKEFQLKYNLVVGFTKNDMGTAYAKVLDYTEDGILYSVIFVNKAIIFVWIRQPAWRTWSVCSSIFADIRTAFPISKKSA